LDRLVSSFFQSLSEEVYAYLQPDKAGDVSGQEDNIIYKISPRDLRELFVRYCREINGWGESLVLICQEVGISVGDLEFVDHELVSPNELRDCHLYLLRFDLMLPHLPEVLAALTGRSISVQESNSSNAKYYARAYQEFRSSLRVPQSLIRDMYEPRRTLMALFYPGRYDSILQAKVDQYGQAG
jgi:hypothetical protein